MDAFVVVAVFEALTSVALWVLLGVIGLRAYRRAGLQSGLWVAAYVLLGQPLSFYIPSLIRSVIDETLLAGLVTPFGWSVGQTVTMWGSINGLTTEISHLLLVALVLADGLYLLTQTGRWPVGRLERLLIALRAYSMPVGLVAVGLLFAPLAVGLLLRAVAGRGT